ncbi:MAG: hypothetical protein JWO81_105 [Alphaproteobacteria bacterium]|nr:hypothetical protein [Alphaproteobacteria bacterium]
MLKGIRAVALLAAAAVALATGPILAQDQEAVFDPVVSATVRIDAVSTGRHGTGWVIEGVDNQNRAGAAVIATSYNIIEGSSEILVHEPGSNEQYHATVLGTDSDRNLAFLEVKDIKARALTLTRTAPKVGRPVWATGYSKAADEAEGPNRLAVNASLKGGRFSRDLRGPVSLESRADVNQLEHDATLLPGFEGGPLVDRCARVVGVNMKSGAKLTHRANLLIQAAAGVMNALKADEVIKAARDKGVDITVKDGEDCGGGSSVAPAAPGASVATAQPNGSAAAPAASQGSAGRLWEMFQSGSTALLLALAGLLGLIALGFGVYTLTRRQAAQATGWEPVPAAPAADPQPPRETPSRAPSSIPPAAGETKVPVSTLRLTGRGPGGDPIELSFSSGALPKGGAMIGVGANADARIPDDRADHRVSRLHARIGYDGRHFTIEDNKSLNKTYVGGKAIDSHTPTPLVNGERIKLADVELSVSIS